MTICVTMVGADGASQAEQQAAIQRFRVALDDTLGGAEMVPAVYAAYVQLRARYGETPDLDSLTDAERLIFEHWHTAYTAALVAALGPHRYLEEPQFELSL